MGIKMKSIEFNLDFKREERTGLSEAIYCGGKSAKQINAILETISKAGRSVLLTHLTGDKFQALSAELQALIDFDPSSCTGFFSTPYPQRPSKHIAIITAGTSDAAVAAEAARTLTFFGHRHELIQDIGVAGLWRLLDRIEEIEKFPIIIAVAGWDGALPTVMGGLVSGAIIALPTSVGYGAAESGRTALNASLTSCTAGIVAVNIDNGYGAACAAIRILTAASRSN